MNEPIELHYCDRFPLKFWLRTGTSDIKAVNEVIEKNSYQKMRKGFSIQKDEEWVDLGANIGAFSVLAAHLGARRVDAYEPDPDSFELLKRNIEENGMGNIIFPNQLAVVADNQKKVWLSVSERNKNYWRNSVVKQWKDSRMVSVPAVHFTKVLSEEKNVKMDIEGAEMSILESFSFATKKLAFEWSFDIDRDCDRFRSAMSHLESLYSRVDYAPINEDVHVWPNSWFPAAKTVFCWV